MSEDMAAVLGRHREAEVETVQGWVMACDCGWTSEGEKSGDDALFAHIARALADAGFGAVGEAKADAAYWNGELRDEYARRRQATMRAEAAEAALASAKAEALREAADALEARDSLEVVDGIDIALRPYRCICGAWHLGHKNRQPAFMRRKGGRK